MAARLAPVLTLFLAAFVLQTDAASATSCDGVRTMSLPNVTVTTATTLPAGPFQPVGIPARPPVVLPAHCRVVVVLTPSADSHIEMELWMPAENWNGKFEAVGNGGWAGVISYAAMAQALNEGYATASTDTGHMGGDALFAIGHPEKLTDFAYRAVHEMTVTAKAIVTAFYGQAPRLSYFNGCSTGGRQGLMEAQKYPQDYDGIVAGAPANNETHLGAWHMAVSAPIVRNPAAALTVAKLEIVHRAVLQACDARDGVTDGLINDPPRCAFDIGTLACRGGDAADCLTADQVTSMRRVYGAATLRDGTVVFPGKEFGSELGLGVSVGGGSLGIAAGDFQIAYGDPAWDIKTFDIDRDLPVADAKVGIDDAIDPDLRAFKAHGGKLLLYHGWNDQLIAPRNTISYYESVRMKLGGTESDFIRLFMAPGMMHCGGGDGPNQFNPVSALERWREQSIVPGEIIAVHVTNGVVDNTRPLCPYPEVAVYSGHGSTKDALSFSCKTAPRIPALR